MENKRKLIIRRVCSARRAIVFLTSAHPRGNKNYPPNKASLNLNLPVSFDMV